MAFTSIQRTIFLNFFASITRCPRPEPHAASVNDRNGLVFTAVAVMLSLGVAGSHFTLCCSGDLDLDPMTFIYELDLYPSRCTCRPKMDLRCQGFLKSSYHRQSHIQTESTEAIAAAASRVVTN